jgi:Flp pilus assembly protein TadG
MHARQRRRRPRQRGSSVLYVVVLSPVLLLGIALATEAGGLQMQKERVRSAVDESVVVAASAASRAGTTVGLDSRRAVAVLREVLAANLAPLAQAFAGTSAAALARDADVAVVTNVPAADPFASGTVLRRPTIEVRVRIPLHTGLFAAAGLPSSVTATLVSAAALRETGT